MSRGFTRRLRRAGWLIIPVLAVMAAPAAAGPPGTEPAVVPLAGTTVITGDRTGYVVVRSRRPLLLSMARRDNRSLSVESDAPLAGVMIRPHEPESFFTIPDAEIVAVRPSRNAGCGGVPCGPSGGILVHGPNADGETAALPAGTYRVYLITDGPARVTLRLAGLSGTASLSPTVAVQSAVRELPRVDAGTDNLVEYGATGPIGAGGAGEMVQIGMFRFQGDGVFSVDSCLYEGGPPFEETAYGPRCGVVGDVGINYVQTPVLTSGDTRCVVGECLFIATAISQVQVLPPRATTWGHGGNIYNPTVISRGFEGRGYWLDFDGTPIEEPEPPVDRTPDDEGTSGGGEPRPASGGEVAPQPAPEPGSPAGAPASPAAPAVRVPAATDARRCRSRRRFRIALREPRGRARLASARVRVDGRRVAVVRRGGRLTATIDLRGRRRGRVRVRIVARTSTGRTVRSTRTYRTCAPRRRAGAGT